jgi:hypothetical protein
MKQIYALGKTEKGSPKIIFNNRQIFDEELKDLSGDIVITISEGRGKRSDRQNKYYWSVCCKLISEHTGYTSEEVHEFLKEKFLTDKHKIVIGGEEREIESATTTRLTTKEFEVYCENIRRFAAQELNINIPEPGEER